MIIYNVTINVDESIHDEWFFWIKAHIQEVLATRKFKEAKLTKVLVEEELGGVTYSIQYKALSRESLDAYYREDANKLRNDSFKRFGNKTVSFRTELEIIDEFSVDLS